MSVPHVGCITSKYYIIKCYQLLRKKKGYTFIASDILGDLARIQKVDKGKRKKKR